MRAASLMLRAPVCVALLGLTACAHIQADKVVEESHATLAAAPVCCGSLAQAQRQWLPLSGPSELLVDATAQVFDFGGNKAYFVLMELPPYQKPYSIEIRSKVESLPGGTTAFVPRVAMYDAAFELTRFFDVNSLRQRAQTLERTVFINPSNAGERYLAIYGSDPSASIDRRFQTVTVVPMVAGPVVFNMVAGGTDSVSRLHSSPTGRLNLVVTGLD